MKRGQNIPELGGMFRVNAAGVVVFSGADAPSQYWVVAVEMLAFNPDVIRCSVSAQFGTGIGSTVRRFVALILARVGGGGLGRLGKPPQAASRAASLSRGIGKKKEVRARGRAGGEENLAVTSKYGKIWFVFIGVGDLVVGSSFWSWDKLGMTGFRKHLRESVFAASATDSREHTDAVVFGRERLGFVADLKQELVLRAGISRGLLNCTRQWGKSTVVAVKAVHHAFTLADRLVVVCSPSLRQSGMFCRLAAGMLRKLGVRVKGTSLELPNGSRIVGLPANDDTVRGYSGATMLLIDEAARVPDAMYAAVKPMLATTSGEMWLMSTPHGKRGFFYKEWMDAQVDWERICVTGAECGRIKDSYLEEERRSLGDLQFRQEYGCEFLDDERAVFPTEWVDEAFRPWAEASQRRMGSRFYVCVDLGQLLDPTAVAVLERWDELTGELNRMTFERTKRRAFAVRWLEKMPLQTSYVDVVERIFSLVRQWKQLGPCAVVVDASGVGAAVLDMLRQQAFSECRLVPVVFTGGGRETFSVDRWHVPKRDLMQGLAVLLEGSGLQVEPRLPEGEALRRELRQVRWEISASGRDLFGGEKEHDDLVMAVALGVWWGRRG